MKSRLQRLYSAATMPAKSIGLGLLCGLLTWVILEAVQTRHLEGVLLEQAKARLNEEAASNRMIFHRYLKQHVQVAQLIAAYQPLVAWLDRRPDPPLAVTASRHENERPGWFPPVSTWRGLINPGHFLLHDLAGNLQASYRPAGNDPPLDGALEYALSNGQTKGEIHLRALAGHPHLVTSSPIKDPQGQRLGKLTLISRIDDEFVGKLNYATDAPNIIVALFEGETGQLVASSQPRRFVPGVRLEQLEEDYLATGKPFFDYGSSELRLRLVTLIPVTRMAALNASFLDAERHHHLIAALAFTASFTWLIFSWSRRIERVLRNIHGISQQVAGAPREFKASGDALLQLERDFFGLRDEIYRARELVRQQQVELQRLRQLELLESVADHLRIGVVLLGQEGGVELETAQVERLAATLGEGWYRPCLKPSAQTGELNLQDKLRRQYTFTVSRLSLFRHDDIVLIQDVTDQKRLRRRIQEQQLQFQRVTQSARDAIISIDAAGKVVHWNRAAEAMFQYSPLQIVGKPITCIMPLAYREAHRSALQRAATSGGAHLVGKTMELEGQRKDGTLFPVELSLSSCELGENHYFTAIVRDIAQRKRAEQALRESESRFALFMDHLPAAVFIKASNGRVLYVNAYLKTHFGRGDVQATNDPGDSASEILEPLSRDDQMVLAEGWYEIVRQLKDRAGTERTFRINNFAIAPAQGDEALVGGIAWDITDTVAATKALRTSERRYRGIFESVEEGIWLIDAVHNTVEVNERLARMFGANDYEMSGHPVFDYMDEQARKEAESLFVQCRKGSAGKYDVRFRTQAGADLWTIVSATPMQDAKGNYAGALMLVTDITERKLAEQRMRAQEEQLRLILASTGEGIFGLDTYGRCTFANRACIETLGFTHRDDLLGKKMHQLIHHTRHDGSKYPVDECPTYRSCTLRNVTFADDELLWRADGSAFHAEYQSFPMVQGDKVVGAVVSFADITERKRAEALLKQERDFAENLIETAPVIVLVLDPAGKILHFNSFMAELSGYALAEVKGRSWFDTFLAAGDVAQVVADFVKARGGVLKNGKQHAIVSRDGKKHIISWYLKRLGDAASEDVGVLAVGLDVTEATAKEAQLVQAQKMETVGQLTDGLAHDFNNLLTVILGNLKLLSDSVDAASAPEAREWLEDAVSATQDGAALTKRLLAFSRQEPLQRKRIDLVAFLQDFIGFLQRTLGSDISIDLDVAARINSLLCDPPQLQSALLNLALNARDAMPKGGRISLRADSKAVPDSDPTLEPGTYVELCVTDTGEGMTPEQLARAIEPFYSTKSSKQGNGLGLSMVYRFCERAGGRFQLASKPGAGTQAVITLPLNGSNGDAAAQELQTMVPTISTANGATVLLVEDDERVRKLAARYLTDLGYHVLMAEDGRKAIETLQSESGIDLVFSDVVMPGGIHGDDLYKWVKEQRPELKVLLTTGRSSGRIKVIADDEQLQIPAPLHKPYTKEQLAKAIRDVRAFEQTDAAP